MFPFSLAAPEFIGFFLVLSLVVLGGTALWVREIEANAPQAKALPSDPYQIAYLRAGRAEAVRVAIVALIDRGIVKHAPDDEAIDVLSLAEGAPALDHPLERRVVAHLATPTRTDALMTPELLKDAEAIVSDPLERRGLLRGTRGGWQRVQLPRAAFFLLSCIVAVRVLQALHSGHNFGGLLYIWLITVFGAFLIRFVMPNAAATAALHALRKLLEDLRRRARALRPGAAPNELALLAAVFGLETLPHGAAPYAPRLHRATQMKDNGGDSGGGSGCGGGGGCGGCGGCGGG